MTHKHTFIPLFLDALQAVGYVAQEIGSAFFRHSYKGFSYTKLFDQRESRAFRMGVRNLKTRGIIKDVPGGRFRFTADGTQWYRNAVHRYFRQAHPRWDGKWRIIIFDIPEERGKQRRQFRRKMQSLGLYMMQESVFVFPYPCEEEIAELCETFHISSYVDVIVAETAGLREADIKKHFDL